MSAKRFAFIHAIISYDNLDSGPEKWSHDRFAAIRDFFEHFKTNYNASLQPDDYQQSMKRCMGAGPKQVSDSKEPGPYYIQGTLPSVKALVNQLKSFIDFIGRTISLDRLYTGLELFEQLSSEGITALGTIDACRRGIAPEIKATTGKQDKSYEHYCEKTNGKLCFNSYVTRTKSKGMKNFMLLSTVSPIF